MDEKTGSDDWDLPSTVAVAWLVWPLTALWLWLTHPGRCALVLKWSLSGKWPAEKRDSP